MSDTGLPIPTGAGSNALRSALSSVLKAAVIGTSVIAWGMFLDVRDLKNDMMDLQAPGAHLSGSLSRTDWEYEKKLLLINHELVKNEVTTLRLELNELRRNQ